MPKPVQMRVSYRDDAGFLIRLEAAVLKDTRQTESWRKTTAEMVHALALRLLAAKLPDGAPLPASVQSEKQRQRAAR